MSAARTILITGCSSGIGYGAAVQLRQRGYRVFATARKEEDLGLAEGRGQASDLGYLNVLAITQVRARGLR